ncbi:MAG: tetratricopeptide repeat protein [Tannerellaceae bacterium]|jgi:tetratricopeptide (TPR) repeat protein|nr:tetratricopeptide repeat protein [Tannerellaceae bacterium]
MAQHKKKKAKPKKTEDNPTALPANRDPNKLMIHFIRKACMAEIKGDEEAAGTCHRKAYEILPCFESASSLAAYLHNGGKYGEAMRYYNESLAFLDETAEPYNEARAIVVSEIASLHNRINEPRKALEYYKEALDIYGTVPIHNEKLRDIIATNIVAAMADIYFILKELDEAERLYVCVMKIDAKLMQEEPESLDRNYAVDALNIGKLYAAKGDCDLAENYYKLSYKVYGNMPIKGDKSFSITYARALVKVAVMHREEYKNGKFMALNAGHALKVLPKCGVTVETVRLRQEAEAIVKGSEGER